MGIRTRDEKISDGEREFMIASCKRAIEQGERTVQAQDFSNKKKPGGS